MAFVLKVNNGHITKKTNHQDSVSTTWLQFLHARHVKNVVKFTQFTVTVEMGGMEGFGLGMEMEQRLRGEEGAERHIFGHSRETGEEGRSCIELW